MPNRVQLSILNDPGYGWFSAMVSAVAIATTVWAGYELGQAREKQSWLTTARDFEQTLEEKLSHIKSAVAQIDDGSNATSALIAVHGAYPSLRSGYLINDDDGTALRVYPARAPLTRLPVGMATGGLISYTQLISSVEALLAINRLQQAYTTGEPPSALDPSSSTYLAVLWRSPRASQNSGLWPLGLAKFDLDVLLNEIKSSSVNRVSLAPFDGAKELIIEIEGQALPIYLSPPTDPSDNRQFWIAALILAVLLFSTQFVLYLQKKRGLALERDIVRMQQVQNRQTRLANLGEVSSRVSHELNQPLFSIEALSATLLRHPDMATEERQSTLTKIRSEAARAARATKAILDFSRAQAKSVRNEAIDIKIVVEQLYPLIVTEAQRRGVRMRREMTADSQGPVDRAAVEIFITTAVTNALEAISEAGLDGPEVLIAVSKPTSDAISIQVSNNGPSIPKETQQSMFDDFYTTKTQGTGLGLSTARTLARQAGGEITFQSIAPNGNPKFTLTLPITTKNQAEQ